MKYIIIILTVFAIILMCQNTFLVQHYTRTWQKMLGNSYQKKSPIFVDLTANRILVNLFLIGYVTFFVFTIVNKGYNLVHLLISGIFFGGAIFVNISMQMTKQLAESIEALYQEHIDDLSSQVNYIVEEIGEYIFQLDAVSGQFQVTDRFKRDYAVDDLSANIIKEEFCDSSLFVKEEVLEVIKEAKQNFSKQTTFSVNLRMKSSEGNFRWNRLKLFCYKDKSGKCLKITGIIQDVDSEEREKQKLVKKAERDLLTGFYNKVTFEMIVNSYLMEEHDKPAYIIMMDVDKFKQINDTYGHHSGDMALRVLSNSLLEVFSKKNAEIGRIGGDEFMVLLKNCEYEGNEQSFLQEIKTAINENLEIKIPDSDQTQKFSVSVGIVCIDQPSLTFDELYCKADELMYDDKKSI